MPTTINGYSLSDDVSHKGSVSMYGDSSSTTEHIVPWDELSTAIDAILDAFNPLYHPYRTDLFAQTVNWDSVGWDQNDPDYSKAKITIGYAPQPTGDGGGNDPGAPSDFATYEVTLGADAVTLPKENYSFTSMWAANPAIPKEPLDDGMPNPIKLVPTMQITVKFLSGLRPDLTPLKDARGKVNNASFTLAGQTFIQSSLLFVGAVTGYTRTAVNTIHSLHLSYVFQVSPGPTWNYLFNSKRDGAGVPLGWKVLDHPMYEEADFNTLFS